MMGKAGKGILGPFSGKVGPVVGVQLGGINIIKAKSRMKNVVPSAPQLIQRKQLGVLSTFFKRIGKAVEVGFKPLKKITSPQNEALKINASYVLTDQEGELIPDYPKLIVSMGDLYPASCLSVSLNTALAIDLSWKDDSENWADDEYELRSQDQLNVLIFRFVPKTGGMSQFSAQVCPRSALKASISLGKQELLGPVAHCWIFFSSADGKKVSKSQYLACPL